MPRLGAGAANRSICPVIYGMRRCGKGEQVEAGANRVIRGGSWNNTAQNARSANRNWNHPGNRNDNLGFRCLSSPGGWMTPC
jgi:formylglycine-generating enzyme required for sulfatase activity